MTEVSDGRTELRAVVRQFLERSADSAAVRRVMADDAARYDHALWRRLCRELGLTGMAVAEEFGGSQASVHEIAVVLEEIGRANLPAPYLSTVLAALALSDAEPDAAVAAALTAIASGEGIAGVHFGDLGLSAGRASGQISTLLDGADVDLLVVIGTERGTLIDLHAPGVTVTPLQTMDLTRGQARVLLDDVVVHELRVPGNWARHTSALAVTLLAAEQIGGARRCLEMATSYAQERVQFGRPIGSFQAIKHLCADMLVEVELARVIYERALDVAVSDAAMDDFAAAASAAKVACTHAFGQLTGDTIRVLGGIGYTWEHDAHLYFRRARAAAPLFGGVSRHLDRIAEHAGLGAKEGS